MHAIQAILILILFRNYLSEKRKQNIFKGNLCFIQLMGAAIKINSHSIRASCQPQSTRTDAHSLNVKQGMSYKHTSQHNLVK